MVDCSVSLHWLTSNPGRQLLTSSFHPIEDDVWSVSCQSLICSSTCCRDDRQSWHIDEILKGHTFESIFYLLAVKKVQFVAPAGFSALLLESGVSMSAAVSSIICQYLTFDDLVWPTGTKKEEESKTSQTIPVRAAVCNRGITILLAAADLGRFLAFKLCRTRSRCQLAQRRF